MRCQAGLVSQVVDVHCRRARSNPCKTPVGRSMLAVWRRQRAAASLPARARRTLKLPKAVDPIATAEAAAAGATVASTECNHSRELTPQDPVSHDAGQVNRSSRRRRRDGGARSTARGSFVRQISSPRSGRNRDSRVGRGVGGAVPSNLREAGGDGSLLVSLGLCTRSERVDRHRLGRGSRGVDRRLGRVLEASVVELKRRRSRARGGSDAASEGEAAADEESRRGSCEGVRDGGGVLRQKQVLGGG